MGDGLLEIVPIEVVDRVDDAKLLAFAGENVGGRKDVLLYGRRSTNQSIRGVGVDLVQDGREGGSLGEGGKRTRVKVTNRPWNMKSAGKMIRGHFRCHVVIGGQIF